MQSASSRGECRGITGQAKTGLGENESGREKSELDQKKIKSVYEAAAKVFNTVCKGTINIEALTGKECDCNRSEQLV